LHEFSDVVGDKLFAIGKWREGSRKLGGWVAGWLGGWQLGCGSALCFQIPCLINTKLMRSKCSLNTTCENI